MGYHVVWDLDLPNRDADLTRLAFFFPLTVFSQRSTSQNKVKLDNMKFDDLIKILMDAEEPLK